ncbi:hypothetical protein NQ315_011549 [Exocentrus adspersus]|uniref:Peptidase S1 domain-containing protein n=1 Tax=Exocentrus adspersus TaxID=1586481 RepID=A0AAV8VUP5_9CUCU|nr:hypothetical protein NQ315_011549 [Exocentrus adspersus]
MSMFKLVAFCSVFTSIIIAIIAVDNQDNAESFGSRIIGGKEVNITKYPYQVAVEMNNEFKCAGSIIARTWILTAAECLLYEFPIKVRIGTSFLLEEGQIFDVQEFINHRDFNQYTGNNDIGLLRLEQPIPLSKSAQIIRLPDNGKETLDGRMGTVTGWGITKKNGPKSPILRAVDVLVVNLDVCKVVYNDSYWRVSDGMLCAGPWDGGKGIAEGDKAGAFVVDSVLVGIASWSSPERAIPEHPGVYTNVGAYRDWITQWYLPHFILKSDANEVLETGLSILHSIFIPIIIAIVIDNQANSESFGSRIIGGEEADITEYPYQVAVEMNKRFRCGGSIIARTWVLTSAECLTPGFVYPVKVRIGTSFLLEGGQILDVQEFIRHPDYNPDTGNNDIALLRMDQPIPLSEFVQIIRLPDNGNDSLEGRIGTVTGWGATTKSGPTSSVLRVVDVPVVNLEACKVAYNGSDWIVSDRMLCAGPWDGGKGVGDGDKGGALVVDSVLVGIFSWFSTDSAETENPGVYTNVGAYRDWITENTGV